MDIKIKELLKNEGYIIEFESRSFFDDSIKGDKKYVYYRIGDITKKVTLPRYSIVVKSINELTTEELMEILNHSISETDHKNRIIKAITNLTV